MEGVTRFYCPRCGGFTFVVASFYKKRGKKSPKKFECTDSDCKFTVYRNAVAAVAAIIEYHGKIIMTRRAKDPGIKMLDLPGGFVDPDETLEDALTREVDEEMKLEIHDLSYLCSFPNKYPYKGITYSTVDSIFVCKTDSIQHIKREEGEIEGYEICDPKKLDLDDVAFESIREALRRYRKSISGWRHIGKVLRYYFWTWFVKG